jgi:hypothetical protein
MAMNRDDVVEALTALAAPLGPFVSHEELLERQDRLVDAGGVELFDVLVELIVSPPSAERVRDAGMDDWNMVLVEVAGALGTLHPDVAMRRLLPLLDGEGARPAVIDILGLVRDVRAIPELARLVRGGGLDTDEMVHLAGALGGIGGAAACRLLQQMRETATPDHHGELLREIDIALQAGGCQDERPGGVV